MSYNSPGFDDPDANSPGFGDPTAAAADTSAFADGGGTGTSTGYTPPDDSRPDPTAAVADTANFADAGGTGTDTGYDTPDPTAHKKTADPTADVSDSSPAFADQGGTAPALDPTAQASDATPPPDPTADASDTRADTRQAAATAPSGDLPFTPDQSLRYGNAAAPVFAAADAGDDPTAAVSDLNGVARGIGAEQQARQQDILASDLGNFQQALDTATADEANRPAPMTRGEVRSMAGSNAFNPDDNAQTIADTDSMAQGGGRASLTDAQVQAAFENQYGHAYDPNHPVDPMDAQHFTDLTIEMQRQNLDRQNTAIQAAPMGTAATIARDALFGTVGATAAALALPETGLVALGGMSATGAIASYLAKGTGETLGTSGVFGTAPGQYIQRIVGDLPLVGKITETMANIPIPEAAQNPLALVERAAQAFIDNPNPYSLAAEIYKNGIANGGIGNAFTQSDEQFQLNSGLQKAGLEYLATSTVALHDPRNGLGDVITLANPIADYTKVFQDGLGQGLMPTAAADAAFKQTTNGVADVLRMFDVFNPLMYAVESPALEAATKALFGGGGVAVRTFLNGAETFIPDAGQSALGNVVRGAGYGANRTLDLFTNLSRTSAANIASGEAARSFYANTGKVGEKAAAIADLYEAFAYKETHPEVYAGRLAEYAQTYLGGDSNLARSLAERVGNGFTARMAGDGARLADVPAMLTDLATMLRGGTFRDTPAGAAALDATMRKYGLREGEAALPGLAAFEMAKADIQAASLVQAGLPVIASQNVGQVLAQATADTLRSLFLLPGAVPLAGKKILDEFVRGGLTGVWGLRPADFQLVRTAASGAIQHFGADSLLGRGASAVERTGTVRRAIEAGVPLDDYLTRTPQARLSLGNVRGGVDSLGRPVTGAADRLQAIVGAPGRASDKLLQTLVSSPTQHLRLSAAYRELRNAPADIQAHVDETIAGLDRFNLPPDVQFAVRHDLAIPENRQDFHGVANDLGKLGGAAPIVPERGMAVGSPSVRVTNDINRTERGLVGNAGRGPVVSTKSFEDVAAHMAQPPVPQPSEIPFAQRQAGAQAAFDRARGAPETLYHGSPVGGLTRDTIRAGDGGMGPGLYLSNDRGIGEMYARGGTPSLYRAEVAPQKVLDIRAPLPADARAAILTISGDNPALAQAARQARTMTDIYDVARGTPDAARVNAALRGTGYDAVALTDTTGAGSRHVTLLSSPSGYDALRTFDALPRGGASGDIAAGDGGMGYLSRQQRAVRDDLNAAGGAGTGTTRDYKPGSAPGQGGRRAGVSDDLIAAWKSGAVNPDEVIATARQYLAQATESGNVPMQHAIEDMLLDHGQAASVAKDAAAHDALSAARRDLFGPSTESPAARAIRRGDELAAAKPTDTAQGAPARPMTAQERLDTLGGRTTDYQGVRTPNSDARFTPPAGDDADTAAFVQSRGAGIPEETGPLGDLFGPNHRYDVPRATPEQAAAQREQGQFQRAAGQQESPFTRNGEIPNRADPTALVSDTYLLPEGERPVARPGMGDLRPPPSLPGQYPDSMFLANNGGVMLSPEAAQARGLAEQSRLSTAQYRRGQFDPAAIGSTGAGGGPTQFDRYRPTYSPPPPPAQPDYAGAADWIHQQGARFGDYQAGRGAAALERGNAIVGNFRQQTPIGELLSKGTIDGKGPGVGLIPFSSFHIHTTQYWAEYLIQHPQAAYAIANGLAQLAPDQYGGLQRGNTYVSGVLELSTAAKLMHWADEMYRYGVDAIRNPGGNNPLQTAAKIAAYGTVGNNAYVGLFPQFAGLGQGLVQSTTDPMMHNGKVDPREVLRERGSSSPLTGAAGLLDAHFGNPVPRNIVSGVTNPGNQVSNLAYSGAVNLVDKAGGSANVKGYDFGSGIPYMAANFGDAQGWDAARTQAAVNDATTKNPSTPDGQALLDAYNRQQDMGGLAKLSPVHASEQSGAPVYPETNPGPFFYNRNAGQGGRDAGVNVPTKAGGTFLESPDARAQSTARAQLKLGEDPAKPYTTAPENYATINYARDYLQRVGDTFMPPGGRPESQAIADRSNAIFQGSLDSAARRVTNDNAFFYNRNAGQGGTDAGVDVPTKAGGTFLESPEQAAQRTAQDQLRMHADLSSAPAMDYARDYLQRTGNDYLPPGGRPESQAIAERSQGIFQGSIDANARRSGAGLPAAERQAYLSDVAPGFTVADLLRQPGNTEALARQYAQAKAAGASKEQLAAIGAALNAATAKDSAQSPAAASYLSQQEAARFAASPGGQWYNGQSQQVKDAYDAFNDLRSSADYRARETLGKGIPDKATDPKGYTAWFKENGTEWTRLSNIVNGAEADILARTGQNPKQIANAEAIAAGRPAPYPTTDIKGPTASASPTGSASSSARSTNRASSASSNSRATGRTSTSTSSQPANSANTFFNEYKALTKGTPEYKAALADPVVRDILGQKGATAAQYDRALTALRADVQKARTGGNGATGATGGTTPQARYEPRFFVPNADDIAQGVQGRVSARLSAFGLPGGAASSTRSANTAAAGSTPPATLPGGGAPAPKATYKTPFTAAQKAAYGRNKGRAA